MNGHRLISRQVRQMDVERFDPGPVPDDGILVRNDYSAVSVGTETWNWIHGAEPGREPAFPRTTGYCNCGTVLAVGSQVSDVQPGERVAGQGNHASHSILRKPYNRVPDDVPSQHAALLTLAAIALHGIRVAKVELGEGVAVVGLGLVGQFALTLARLAGAMPLIAIDLDPFRLDKAVERGADAAINPARNEDVAGQVRPCVWATARMWSWNVRASRGSTLWPCSWCAALDGWWQWVRRAARWTSTFCAMSTCAKSASWARSIRPHPNRATSITPGQRSGTGTCFYNSWPWVACPWRTSSPTLSSPTSASRSIPCWRTLPRMCWASSLTGGRRAVVA
jgi:hypothetical protein